MGSYIDNVRCGNCDAGLMLEASIVTIQNYREQPDVRHFWVYCSFCATHKLYWPTVRPDRPGRRARLQDRHRRRASGRDPGVLPEGLLAPARQDPGAGRPGRRGGVPPEHAGGHVGPRPGEHRGRSRTCRPTGRIDRRTAGVTRRHAAARSGSPARFGLLALSGLLGACGGGPAPGRHGVDPSGDVVGYCALSQEVNTSGTAPSPAPGHRAHPAGAGGDPGRRHHVPPGGRGVRHRRAGVHPDPRLRVVPLLSLFRRGKARRADPWYS